MEALLVAVVRPFVLLIFLVVAMPFKARDALS